MRKTFFTAAVLLLYLNPATIFSASFDCKKAKSDIEKMICASPPLSKLDEQMNAAYKAALRDEKKAPSVRQAQKKWVIERNGCSDVTCVKQAYEARLAALGSSVGAVPEHDEYVAIEQDLDETTDYLFHIERDPKVCHLYEENLNYFAHQDMPLSCDRPISPQLKTRIQEVEWEDLKPENYSELLRQMILVESFGRANSTKDWKNLAQQVETREYLFRRAKVELQGKTFRQFNETYGLPYSNKGQTDSLSGKFVIVQYGRNDKDIHSPSRPCKAIRGGGTTSARFYLVNDRMDGVVNYLRVAVKGDFGRDKLLLIDGKLYAEDIFSDATVHLLRVMQGDRIELEMLCGYRFETSCRLPGRETFDPERPFCKPNLD